MKKFLLLFVFALGIVGCENPTYQKQTITIASKKRSVIEPEGGRPCQVMMKKTSSDNRWVPLYESIGGFEFESGYECVLDVKQYKIIEHGTMLGYEYNLIKVISKEKKVSENLLVGYEAEVITIASEKLTILDQSGDLQSYYLVKKEKSDKWEFVKTITNFDDKYQTGYEYTFSAIMKTADTFDDLELYCLLSKTQKTSENLPSTNDF